MPTRKYNQNTYKHGSHNELCDVCGFKFKTEDMKDRWDGLRVCADDWEVRHPSDFFRSFPDDQNVDNADADFDSNQADASNTDVSGNTFPDTSDPNNALTDIPDGTFDGSLP